MLSIRPKLTRFWARKRRDRPPSEGSYATPSETGALLCEPRLAGKVLLGSSVINILGLAIPLTILQIYDRIIPNQSFETLTYLSLSLLVVVLFDFGLRSGRSALMAMQAMHFIRSVENEVVLRLMNSPIGLVEQEPLAVYLHRFNALRAIGNYCSGTSRLVALDSVFAAITLAIMAMVGGLTAFAPVLLFMVFGLLALRQKHGLRAVILERSRRDNQKYDFVSEVLGGILSVKSMAMEPQMQRRFERLQQAAAETTMRAILSGQHIQALAAVHGTLSQLSVVAVGAFLVIDGKMSIGSLACCTMLSGQVLQPVFRAISLWIETESLKHSRAEAQALLALPPVALGIGSLPSSAGKICFERVDFDQSDRKHSPLKDISFTVAPGRIIGLQGDDGSGRTTLLRMIKGDLTPTAGRVLVDDIATTQPTFRAMRPLIVYVGQMPVTFRGTIIDNLTMFRTERVELAHRIADLLDLQDSVNQLPNGFETKLGESISEDLPASLVQQISIARALVAQPRILLLDEANGLLDRRADAALIKAVDGLRGQLTLVVATHRPSLLSKCDAVHVLQSGRLVVPVQTSTASEGRNVA